jgi:hypothetical protein
VVHRRGNIHVILRPIQHRHHQLLVIDLEPVELVIQQRSDSEPQRARQKFGPYRIGTPPLRRMRLSSQLPDGIGADVSLDGC